MLEQGRGGGVTATTRLRRAAGASLAPADAVAPRPRPPAEVTETRDIAGVDGVGTDLARTPANCWRRWRRRRSAQGAGGNKIVQPNKCNREPSPSAREGGEKEGEVIEHKMRSNKCILLTPSRVEHTVDVRGARNDRALKGAEQLANLCGEARREDHAVERKPGKVGATGVPRIKHNLACVVGGEGKNAMKETNNSSD